MCPNADGFLEDDIKKDKTKKSSWQDEAAADGEEENLDDENSKK